MKALSPAAKGRLGDIDNLAGLRLRKLLLAKPCIVYRIPRRQCKDVVPRDASARAAWIDQAERERAPADRRDLLLTWWASGRTGSTTGSTTVTVDDFIRRPRTMGSGADGGRRQRRSRATFGYSWRRRLSAARRAAGGDGNGVGGGGGDYYEQRRGLSSYVLLQ